MAQVGNSLRVLAATDGDAEARVVDALRTAGLHAGVAPVRPNLEDVFVAATRGRDPRREAA